MASMKNMRAWLGMLVVETIAKIRRAYFVQKKPIKAICRELGLSRKVVRKVLRSGATEFRYTRETQPLPKIGPWRDELDALLLANRATDLAFDTERTETKLSLQDFLKARHPAWNLVGRVHFNLAENRKDEAAPFAFLATYTTRLSAEARAQHLPLGKALQEYAGARNRERLLSLLLPVQRAAESHPWLKQMVDSGEIFHPLRWTPQQALQLLKDAPALESAGVVLRMPASWRMNRPARPRVKATVGGKAPGQLGMDALLDFRLEVTLDGESLSASEIRQLLAQSDGLVLIRGKWVEIDRERLSRTLEQFRTIEDRAGFGRGRQALWLLQDRFHTTKTRSGHLCGPRGIGEPALSPSRTPHPDSEMPAAYRDGLRMRGGRNSSVVPPSTRLLWQPLVEDCENQQALPCDDYGPVHTGAVLASPEAGVRR
jgi:hypothetical protein